VVDGTVVGHHGEEEEDLHLGLVEEAHHDGEEEVGKQQKKGMGATSSLKETRRRR